MYISLHGSLPILQAWASHLPSWKSVIDCFFCFVPPTSSSLSVHLPISYLGLSDLRVLSLGKNPLGVAGLLVLFQTLTGLKVTSLNISRATGAKLSDSRVFSRVLQEETTLACFRMVWHLHRVVCVGHGLIGAKCAVFRGRGV